MINDRALLEENFIFCRGGPVILSAKFELEFLDATKEALYNTMKTIKSTPVVGCNSQLFINVFYLYQIFESKDPITS